MRRVLIAATAVLWSIPLVGFPPRAAAQAAAAAPASEPASTDPCSAHARPTFDVSVVKPSQTPMGSTSLRYSIDGVKATGSLRHLVLFAYNLRDFQLEGGQDWLNTATWEVRATIDPPDPDPSKMNEAQRLVWSDRQRARFQALLVDRFHLKCHMTTKEQPIYQLVVAKGGLKITETAAATEKQHSISVNGQNHKMEMKAIGVDMADLMRSLSGDLGRMVVDKTGLTGHYDVNLTWASEAEADPGDAPSGPTLFTALEEQLGLKLVPAKGPVDVLVIDSLEKPSEN